MILWERATAKSDLKLLTFDQNVAPVRFCPSRVEYVNIQKQDLGARVSSADFVMLGLQRPIPLDCVDVLDISRAPLVLGCELIRVRWP